MPAQEAKSAPPSGSLGAPPGAPSAPEAKPKPAQAAASDAKPAAKGKPIPGQYIVTLKAGANPRSVAASAKVDPIYVYETALTGFTAKLNDEQLNALRNNKAVQAIEQDQTVITDEAARCRSRRPPGPSEISK